MNRLKGLIKSVFRSKRGSELIEASLALPLLILMTASLIGAGTFAWENMRDRCGTQAVLLEELDESSAIYRKIEKTSDTSSDITGAYHGRLSRRYAVYARAIDEDAVIRAGDLTRVFEGGENNEQE